jgi:hypothetical protein
MPHKGKENKMKGNDMTRQILMVVVLVMIVELSMFSGSLFQASGEVDTFPGASELDRAVAGYYYGDGKIVCSSPRSCAHESGHAVNEFFNRPAQSDEFKLAVDHYIEYCDFFGIDKDFLYSTIKNFPGIYGNEYTEVTYEDGSTGLWGGYNELYATIYMYDMIYSGIETPRPLRWFFTEYWTTVTIDELEAIQNFKLKGPH